VTTTAYSPRSGRSIILPTRQRHPVSVGSPVAAPQRETIVVVLPMEHGMLRRSLSFHLSIFLRSLLLAVERTVGRVVFFTGGRSSCDILVRCACRGFHLRVRRQRRRRRGRRRGAPSLASSRILPVVVVVVDDYVIDDGWRGDALEGVLLGAEDTEPVVRAWWSCALYASRGNGPGGRSRLVVEGTALTTRGGQSSRSLASWTCRLPTRIGSRALRRWDNSLPCVATPGRDDVDLNDENGGGVGTLLLSSV
jgi:hypothetical protein